MVDNEFLIDVPKSFLVKKSKKINKEELERRARGSTGRYASYDLPPCFSRGSQSER